MQVGSIHQRTQIHWAMVAMMVISMLVNMQTALACQMNMMDVGGPMEMEHHDHFPSNGEQPIQADCCSQTTYLAHSHFMPSDAGPCCDTVSNLEWVGTHPEADVDDPPLLVPLAFEWLAPLFVVDILTPALISTPSTLPQFEPDTLASSGLTPVYQRSERYRL